MLSFEIALSWPSNPPQTLVAHVSTCNFMIATSKILQACGRLMSQTAMRNMEVDLNFHSVMCVLGVEKQSFHVTSWMFKLQEHTNLTQIPQPNKN